MRWAAVAASSSWEEDIAKPLPIPWEKLARVIKPKAGDCLVIIAAPGIGKTTLLVNWAAKAHIPTLYLSADTSAQDLTVQLSSLATGHDRRSVETRMVESSTWRREYSRAVMKAFPDLVLDFSPRPTMREIREKTAALTELWGITPQMIVMDTASNVAMKDMSDNAEWQRVWLQAIQIARDFNAVFVFAHHVKQGPARSGRLAPEMSDALWGADQFSSVVIGVHEPQAGIRTLTVRKNRTGPKDVPIKLTADLPHADLRDHEVMATDLGRPSGDNVTPLRRS